MPVSPCTPTVLCPTATIFSYSVPICIAVFLGSLGFPVFIAIQRNPFRPRHWSLTAC